MLTCSCGDDDYDWWYWGNQPIAPLATKRSRRCKSCEERIAVGDDCRPFARWHRPNNDLEERIYDDEVPMATWYLCDRCAGLYESLSNLGFCDLLGQDMRALCREYADMQREAGVFRGQMIMRKP